MKNRHIVDPLQLNPQWIFPSDFVTWQGLEPRSPSQCLISPTEKQLLQLLQGVTPIEAVREYHDSDPITKQRRVVDLWAKLFLTYLRVQRDATMQDLLLEHLDAVRSILTRMHNQLLTIAEDNSILLSFLEHPQESSGKFLSCFLRRLGCLVIKDVISNREQLKQDPNLIELETILIEAALQPSITLQKIQFNHNQTLNISTKNVSPLGATIESFVRKIFLHKVEAYFKKKDYAAEVRSMTPIGALRRISKDKLRKALSQSAPLKDQSIINTWREQMSSERELIDFTLELIKDYKKYYKSLYQERLVGAVAKKKHHYVVCREILRIYKDKYPELDNTPAIEELSNYLESCGLYCKNYYGKSLKFESLEDSEQICEDITNYPEDVEYQHIYNIKKLLKKAFSNVEDESKRILFLRHALGLSEQVISDMLNCSQPTINRRIRRVTQQCMQEIIEADIEFDDRQLKLYKPAFTEYIQQHYNDRILGIAVRRLRKIIPDLGRQQYLIKLIYTQGRYFIQEVLEIKELKKYLRIVLKRWVELNLKLADKQHTESMINQRIEAAIEEQLEEQYAFLIQQLQQ
jgi:AraC-like DNA-binding protein